MRNIWLVLVLTLFPIVSNAQEPDGALPTDEGTYAGHRNFIGSGLRYTFGVGPTLMYSRRLTSQLLVGTSVGHDWHSRDSEGGSLDTAQYYKETFKVESTSIEINATYFFRNNGYARWGFLMRGGLGRSHSQGKAEWTRYDRNPAIIIIGDEKRALDSGNDTRNWDSTFVRLAGYYQFLFGFKSGSRFGHVLEIGAGGVYSDRQQTLFYTKPNGERVNREIPRATPLIEFNYSLAF